MVVFYKHYVKLIFSPSSWLFRSGRVSKKYDYFNCIDRNIVPDTEEMKNLRGGDADKLYSNESAEGQQPPPVVIRKPGRKPDPSVRELRRQISFGSGGGFGSLKKKSSGAAPPLGATGPAMSVDSAGPSKAQNSRPELGRATSLVSPPPAILEDGESTGLRDDNGEGIGVMTSPTEMAKRMLHLDDRKDSLRNLKENIKEGLTEMKHEIKDHVKHLPDGHRGSLAAVVERPPYKPIKPVPSDQDIEDNKDAKQN